MSSPPKSGFLVLGLAGASRSPGFPLPVHHLPAGGSSLAAKWVDLNAACQDSPQESLKRFYFRVRTPLQSLTNDLLGSTRLSLRV